MTNELFIKKHGEDVKLQIDESIVEFGFRGLETKLVNLVGEYDPMKDRGEGFRKAFDLFNDSLSYIRTRYEEALARLRDEVEQAWRGNVAPWDRDKI